MDWHLVGDSYSLCVLKTKEPKAFVVSSPTNSFQSLCCQVKDVQSTAHEPAMHKKLNAQETSLDYILDAWEILSTWLLDRLQGCKLPSI